MRGLRLGTALLAAQTLTGCVTTRLPLCPTIAERSYDQGKPPGPLGAYADRVVADRHIRVEVLSPFNATFRGSKGDIGWLLANYPDLICAFDPRQVGTPQSTYTSCMAHAPDWISVLRSDHPETLMLARHLYYENCIIPLPRPQ